MQEFLGFGVVGNFAGHLEQAGESHSFINMKSEEKDAPKGYSLFISRMRIAIWGVVALITIRLFCQMI